MDRNATRGLPSADRVFDDKGVCVILAYREGRFVSVPARGTVLQFDVAVQTKDPPLFVGIAVTP